MAHERFIYTLRSECFSDFPYLILQPNMHSFQGQFSGELGEISTTRKQSATWTYFSSKFYGGNETETAEHLLLTDEIADIVGLSTWNVHQCGNKDRALMKLSNVSKGKDIQ